MKFIKELTAFENAFNDSEMDLYLERIREFIRVSVQKLPLADRQKILNWIESVQSIKADASLSPDDKVRQLEELDAGTVATQIFKSSFQIMSEKFPEQQRGLFQNGMVGMGMWAVARRPELAVFANVAFQKVLPRFLLLPQGDQVLVILKEWLQEKMVEIR